MRSLQRTSSLPLLLTALLLLSGGIAALLHGCAAAPQTREAAKPVAEAFLQARVSRDAAVMHALLTQRAQEALGQEQIARYIRTETVGFGSVGAPLEREDGWIQIPVRNLEIRRGSERTRWPESYLTARHDGRRWRIAWAEPLMAAAQQSYERGAYVEELNTGRTLAEIDPFHYRGYLEQHFGYRGLKQHQLAEHWLLQAARAATDAQTPDVHDAMARFKLDVRAPADAARYAQRALREAEPYIPDTYSVRWKADTLTILARALLVLGDRAGAGEVARQAGEIDPQNGSLAVFRWQLSSIGP